MASRSVIQRSIYRERACYPVIINDSSYSDFPSRGERLPARLSDCEAPATAPDSTVVAVHDGANLKLAGIGGHGLGKSFPQTRGKTPTEGHLGTARDCDLGGDTKEAYE